MDKTAMANLLREVAWGHKDIGLAHETIAQAHQKMSVSYQQQALRLEQLINHLSDSPVCQHASVTGRLHGPVSEAGPALVGGMKTKPRNKPKAKGPSIGQRLLEQLKLHPGSTTPELKGLLPDVVPSSITSALSKLVNAKKLKRDRRGQHWASPDYLD